jgi:hypothetical protein
MLICNRIIFCAQVEYRFEEMSFIYFKIDRKLTNSSKIHKTKKMLIFGRSLKWNIFRKFIRKTGNSKAACVA